MLDNRFLITGLEDHCAGSVVFDHVCASLVDGGVSCVDSFTCGEDGDGEVVVSRDAADGWRGAEALLDALVVSEGVAFSAGCDSAGVGCVCAPHADVALIGASEDVAGIEGVHTGCDALHALCVVHIAR